MSGQSKELKLYTSLRVDVTELGRENGTMEMPDPDFVGDSVRERFSAYHNAIQTVLTAAPLETDLTSLFQADFSTLEAFRDLTGKVSSLRLGVEDVEGKFFGTAVCRLNGDLEAMELLALKEYCRSLFDEGLGNKAFQCPASPVHGELSVRVWRSKGGFMLTEDEVAMAPWCKERRQKLEQKRQQQRKRGESR